VHVTDDQDDNGAWKTSNIVFSKRICMAN